MSKAIFKKLGKNKFERITTGTTRTILDKEELEKSKKLLEKEIAVRQKQLSFVNGNLNEINKIKK